MTEKIKMAEVDFECMEPSCDGVVAFNLANVLDDNFQALCPKCHRAYEFEDEIKGKLAKFVELIKAVRAAEDILGNCEVAVNVGDKAVKIPYVLLLTRLNTIVTLSVGGEKVDFHFRVEPSSPETFK